MNGSDLLDPVVQAVVAREGFAVVDEKLREFFQAYDQSTLPVYVTEDSVWHCGKVLTSSALKYVERRQNVLLRVFASRLRSAVLKRIVKDPSNGSLQGVLVLVEVANKLYANECKGLPESIGMRVDKILAFVEHQQGEIEEEMLLPSMLNKALFVPPLNYSSEELRRYFIARRWLSSVVLESNSEALLSMAINLTEIICSDPTLLALWDGLSDPWIDFMGEPGHLTVKDYAICMQRAWGSTIPPQGNDRAAVGKFQNALAERVAELRPIWSKDKRIGVKRWRKQASFRLLPATITISEVALSVFGEKVDDAAGLETTGLAAIAHGGSTLYAPALSLLSGESEGLANVLLSHPLVYSYNKSLFEKSLAAIEAMGGGIPGELESTVSVRWPLKQLWSQLGLWAELEHASGLYSRRNAIVFGDSDSDGLGCVAPVPEFFHKLSGVVREYGDYFRKYDGALAVDRERSAVRLLAACMAARNRLLSNGDDEVQEFLGLGWQSVEGRVGLWALSIGDGRETWLRNIDSCEEVARRELAREKLAAEEEDLLLLGRESGEGCDLFDDLESLCEQLGSKAEEQRSIGITLDRDPDFFRHYARRVSRLCLYRSPSSGYRDDTAIVCPVLIREDVGELVYVGVGRPEALYVIVKAVIGDGEARPVICRGAVLSYRETIVGRNEAPIDDQQWRVLCSKDKLPLPPKFTASFRATQ